MSTLMALNPKWEAQRAEKSRTYASIKRQEWIPAIVPGTVLTTLVYNRQLPDPFYGANNELIPDISDVGRDFYTYWFKNVFFLGHTDSSSSSASLLLLNKKEKGTSRQVWLEFRGVNYSFRAYVNGREVTGTGCNCDNYECHCRLDANTGMFLRHVINITGHVRCAGSNELCVLVLPPPHPGRVDRGGQGGDHDIAKDVTAQFVEGWDWVIPIRDRNTGIWDKVVLNMTGPVRIVDPHIVATFPMAKADDDDDDDDDDGYRVAQLSVAVSLENSHTEQVSGKVIFELSFEEEEEEKEEEDDEEDGDDVNRNGRISCFKSMVCVELVREEAFRIPAGGALTHVFSPMLHHNPRLWWPNGLGPHPLYNVRISVHVDDSNNINNNNNNNNNNKDKATHFSSLSFSSQSDEWTGRFGFREIKTHVDTATGGRVFVVNGQRVFIRGGNWTVSDGMLRLSRARYAAEVRLHASANLNMIRVWGGALTERPDFYDACDENGILVWQEFWITGDCNGRGLPPSDRAWPLDHALFLRSATDAVRMLRNHASLAIWVGGNECTPPPDIIDRLQTLLARPPPGQHPHTPLFLDGTRDYVQGSLWDGFAKGNGDFSDGPYGIQEPRALFAPDFYPYAFNPEVGSVGVPDADTIRATMPPEAWAPPVLQKRPDGLLEEVWNKMWEYHKYIPYTQPGKVRSQVALYGEPRDLDSFCEQAQLANFVQYRALVESWNSRMWRSATGMLIWKTQNPWPGLRGQLYDCHLADTGGLYGVQRAAEPVHIQLNLATRDIEVINSTRHSLSSHMVRAIVVDLDGLPLCPDLHWSGLDLEPNSATTIGHLPDPTQDGHHHDPARQPLDLLLSPPPPPALSSAYFVVLYLRDAASGAQVSRNLYWLHGPGGDYVAMGGRWREQAVPVQVVVLSCTVKGGVCRASVTVENRGGGGRDTETEAGSRSADFVESHESLMGDMMQKCCSLCTRNSGGGVSAGEGTDESKCSSSGCLGCCGSRGPVAFWVRLRAEYEGQPKKMDTKEGDEQVDDVRVLPAYFSNNYVSLLHGEKCVVNIEFEIKGDGGPVVLIVRGWNVPEQRLPLRPQ